MCAEALQRGFCHSREKRGRGSIRSGKHPDANHGQWRAVAVGLNVLRQSLSERRQSSEVYIVCVLQLELSLKVFLGDSEVLYVNTQNK